MRHRTLRLSEASPHHRRHRRTNPAACLRRQLRPGAGGFRRLDVTHRRASKTHIPLVAVAQWAERRSTVPEPRALSARVSAPRAAISMVTAARSPLGPHARVTSLSLSRKQTPWAGSGALRAGALCRRPCGQAPAKLARVAGLRRTAKLTDLCRFQ